VTQTIRVGSLAVEEGLIGVLSAPVQAAKEVEDEVHTLPPDNQVSQIQEEVAVVMMVAGLPDLAARES
jgi:hypothetical protein